MDEVIEFWQGPEWSVTRSAVFHRLRLSGLHSQYVAWSCALHSRVMSLRMLLPRCRRLSIKTLSRECHSVEPMQSASLAGSKAVKHD